MLKNLKNIIYLSTFILFIFFVFFYYFSDKNISKVNKTRSLNYTNLHINISKLPLLLNDTNDIIEYLDIKSKKKYNKFFDFLSD